MDSQEQNLTTAELAGRPMGSQPPQRAPFGGSPQSDEVAEGTPLLSPQEVDDLRTQWYSIQGSFVDEPRKAVEQADNLVAVAMKRLAETFADERSKLEAQWDREGSASTEDLRIAMQRYRSFFNRLLVV